MQKYGAFPGILRTIVKVLNQVPSKNHLRTKQTPRRFFQLTCTSHRLINLTQKAFAPSGARSPPRAESARDRRAARNEIVRGRPCGRFRLHVRRFNYRLCLRLTPARFIRSCRRGKPRSQLHRCPPVRRRPHPPRRSAIKRSSEKTRAGPAFSRDGIYQESLSRCAAPINNRGALRAGAN